MVVKVLLFLLLLGGFLYANQEMTDTNETTIGDLLVQEDPLISKIKSFVGEETYIQNKEFVNVIFDPKSDFYTNDRVNAVKVIQTLKDNGLLKLFFQTPQAFVLHFKTNGSPLFFVKLMGDTLRNIGYFRYVTTASKFDVSEFIWSISLRSEYATDPLILQNELAKSGCSIVDIQRDSAKEWSYTIDITNAYLNVKVVEPKEQFRLKRSLYAYWLNISKVRTLKIKSPIRNNWYPNIAYYDAALHLVKLLKKDKIFRNVTLRMPKSAKYIKISDLYTLKNVKSGLSIEAKGSR